MKRVICVVEDEKDLNNLVAQYLRKYRIIFSNFYIFVLLYLNFLNGDIGIWREKRTGLRKY